LPRAWRLCKRRYAASAFSGEGARAGGGRWNLPGTAVVYTSGSLSLAALEALVHMDAGDAPDDLVAMAVDIPEGLHVKDVAIRELPRNWRATPGPPALQRLGSEWAKGLETAVLSVPSVVVPQERNYLLNPAHADLKRIRIGKPMRFVLDARAWK